MNKIEANKNELDLSKKIAKVRLGMRDGYAREHSGAFKNKYADINDIIQMLDPMLEDQNLLLTQPIIENNLVTVITDTDTGEQVVSSMALPAQEDSTPHSIGSAITYYRRYTLVSLLALRADDDDGNSASMGSQAYQKTRSQANTMASKLSKAMVLECLEKADCLKNGEISESVTPDNYTKFKQLVDAAAGANNE